ncbi:TetR/AcrR family transcriptional regulator [Kineococcus sp. SYSU DK003]|uniref:TetR/AcrR family transcriptional regulator n=1 Tax=Kineococcus sp. SYSU DK003 TaxID=3383124 RepID=UPI003D7D44D6
MTDELARRPSGRRRGDSGTRAAILQAAREQFAIHGYRGATMRTIAAAAGVDPALIRHFHGSKDELFAATVDFPSAALDRVLAALAGDHDGLGERVARVYLGLWEDPETSAPLLAVFRSAVGSERAAGLLREFLRGRVLSRVAPNLGVESSELRTTLAVSHLLGTAVARYVLRVPPLADLETEELVAVLAPAIQRYLTGPLPTGGDQA